MRQLFPGLFIQTLPGICTPDIVPPVWDDTVGIVSLQPQPNGSLLGTCGTATDAISAKVFYVWYCQPVSEDPSTLFADQYLSDITLIPTALLYDYGPTNVILESGHQYRVGVRAADQSLNLEYNTAYLEAMSVGVLTSDIATLAHATLAAYGASNPCAVGVVEVNKIEGTVQNNIIEGVIVDAIVVNC